VIIAGPGIAGPLCGFGSGTRRGMFGGLPRGTPAGLPRGILCGLPRGLPCGLPCRPVRRMPCGIPCGTPGRTVGGTGRVPSAVALPRVVIVLVETELVLPGLLLGLVFW